MTKKKDTEYSYSNNKHRAGAEDSGRKDEEMTKAEKVFRETYEGCKAHISAFGTKRDEAGKVEGFHHLYLPFGEKPTKRLFQDLTDALESAHRSNDLMFKFKAIDEETHEREKDILLMVGQTLVNAWENYKAEGRA